ncbi:MAG: ImmA/IrrE family metallo-endopeptidase [Firmicutes bacterium]|nr:ImmA/IrrE family metallo-endopeptidase [Bacillota bacterium]
MWIEKKDKSKFLDSKMQGLRIKYSLKPDIELKNYTSGFIKWLRFQYFFPIRCNIVIKPCPYFITGNDNKTRSHGDFYYYDDPIKKVPSIWISSGEYYTSKEDSKFKQIKEILFTIAHELTHYFQWYFYEFDNRTDRSLEIEANRWAWHLVNDFLIYYQKP